MTEQVATQGLSLISWEVEMGTVDVKARRGARGCVPPSAHAAQIFAPNGTLLHDLAPTDKSHLGFQAKDGGGDFRACFSATPHHSLAPEELLPPAAVQVTDPETGAVTLVTPEVPPEIAAARAAAEAQAGARTRLRVDWLTGVAAKDWDSVAKKDHLSELSAALSELEGELQSVYRSMLDMRSREEQMRDLSEAVNAKVAWTSAASLTVSCVLALWQVLAMRVRAAFAAPLALIHHVLTLNFLKAYFRKRKLI